jgi:hypothetical protein
MERQTRFPLRQAASVAFCLDVIILPHLVHPRKAVDLPERIPPARRASGGAHNNSSDLEPILKLSSSVQGCDREVVDLGNRPPVAGRKVLV